MRCLSSGKDKIYNTMNEMAFTILLSAITGLIALIVADIYVHVKNLGKKAIKKHNDERDEEIKRLITEVLDANISKELLEVKRDVSKMTLEMLPKILDGLQCSLRDGLTNMFVRCDANQARTLQDTENATHRYTAYRALGGNSYIPEMYKNFLSLPLDTIEKNRVENKQEKINVASEKLDKLINLADKATMDKTN